MATIDDSELDILDAFDKGQLKSVATKSELAKFKAAARATAPVLVTQGLEIRPGHKWLNPRKLES